MKKWLLIRSCLLIFIAVAFILLENVVGVRRILLTGLFFVYALMPIVRVKMKNETLQMLSLIIDIGLVFCMSAASRYVINYYIYVLYMSLLLEVGLTYTLKWSKYMMAIIIGVSLYHYGVLFNYRSNLGTVSEIIFMSVINGLILFSVILNDRNRKEKITQLALNKALQDSNDQLEVFTTMAVKNNIARDIHDTFGHDMMALIMALEMAQILIDSDIDQTKKILIKAKQSARDGMKTIRKVVETLRNDDREIIDKSIEDMIVSFQEKVSISVTYHLYDSIDDLPKKPYGVLYRLIQECLTNSIRHGKADGVVVEIKEGLHTIVFDVKDNGVGSSEIIEGYGLKGMRERVEELNGSLRIKGNDGFHIEGFIEVTDD